MEGHERLHELGNLPGVQATSAPIGAFEIGLEIWQVAAGSTWGQALVCLGFNCVARLPQGGAEHAFVELRLVRLLLHSEQGGGC